MNINSVMNAYQAQSDYSANKSDKTKENSDINSTNSGRTIGEPELSEKAQKYYEQLKKKYGQYDFILVSSAEKENARANAGAYANSLKTVVLIDEEKIERMATDEKYRKQYEGILSGATQQIEQIKAAAQSAGASLKGVVMQVNDNGTTSFFAALQKSSDAQKERIEKKSEQKKEEKKAEQKKAAREEEQERLEKLAEKNSQKLDSEANDMNVQIEERDDGIVTIMADSFDSLIKKIEEYAFNERSNSVQTESEKLLGQNIDFRG